MRDRRRALLKAVPGALLALEVPLAHGATIVAVRVWPARDYTRVTLELDRSLRTSHFTISDPPRLVVDLQGAAIDDELREIVAKVQPNDPYIASVRVGQNRPRVVRLVLDLKTPVAPQVFTLAPVERYQHRLVMDLHPAVPADPLLQLADPSPAARTAAAAATARSPVADPHGANATSAAAESASAAATPGASAPGPSASASAAGGRASAASPAGGTPSAATDPIGALIRSRDPVAIDARSRDRRPAVTRMVTIAIDPGHGGEDPGAVGRGGTLEKDVVLAVAFKLRDRINAEPNMRAFLTRDSDYFVPLATRVSKARAVSADLFVSVHADAFVLPQARGSSVFVLSNRSASSVGARWLASRENRSDLIGGVNLPRRNREVARVLLDLSTTAQMKESRRLGDSVLGELRVVGNLHKPSVEQAAFAVLRAPDIPSILVETAFISNPDEERRLRDPRYQARLAEAMHAGIVKYFRRHPPGPRSGRVV
jgi:N-acetylmuramoyl-L-alanine amidase